MIMEWQFYVFFNFVSMLLKTETKGQGSRSLEIENCIFLKFRSHYRLLILRSAEFSLQLHKSIANKREIKIRWDNKFPK